MTNKTSDLTQVLDNFVVILIIRKSNIEYCTLDTILLTFVVFFHGNERQREETLQFKTD